MEYDVMKNYAANIIVLIGISIPAMATEVEIIPYGAPPLLNGREGHNEWLYPFVQQWGWTGAIARLKQDSHFVYISIIDRDTAHTGLDFYLDNTAGGIMMFHVSSAHGERHMTDSGWGEMKYGPPESWGSNIVESIFEDGHMKFIPPDIFEFQIAKSRLPSRTFKFMVHLKRPEKLFPADADTLASDTWIEEELYR